MATSDHAAELKAQGALEAARDPNSSVTVEAAEHAAMAHAKAAGAPTFEFDPNASPEEKKAQMKAQAPIDRPHRKHQVAALATDQDDGQTAGYDLPPPSKAGAVASPASPDANGSIARDPNDPYSKTGWAPRFGNPADKEESGTLLDHQDFLESKLDDKFFGDWYHNAAIIVIACLSSWVVAVLGGSLGWVFIIMAACGTYYRTSIRRVRRNFRDDITRELAKTKLETDTETLEWINSFLTKFWPIYAPVLCASIISTVDQVLSTSTPSFLDSMRMKMFTLGTKPPRLEHVKTYPKTEDDIVLMDWKFSFTPNDTQDMTARQLKNKVNPKVVLEVRIGKAMISKGLDIIVEDMACTGIMRVKVKLQLEFPHIERVDICFLGRPDFDYVCKPIGGDMLGFDMNFLPGLENFIKEQIHGTLAPMMYDPNVFPIEIAKMLAGSPVDQAIGVLQVTFHGAQGLKNPDKFSGTPDPYAVLSINNRDALGKTKTIEQSANPRWNETVNIILTSLREPLTMQIFDYNEYRKDKELGTATFNLEKLEGTDDFENQQLEILAGGRPRGVLQCDIRFFPVLQGQKMADGTEVPPPESLTGIAEFNIEQAKDLDGTKSLVGQLNPYAVLLLNGKEVQTSQKLKRTNNPIWSDAKKELLITDRKKAKMGIVIKDNRDLSADPILGSYQIKLDDLLDLTNKGQEWYNLAGTKAGRVKMALNWKPVALRGALAGGGYIDPIGVMRFHFQSAKDLKNLDTVGKSDPYARVLLSGIPKGRTVTWKNNLSPQFDEIFYVPVHSAREKLVVEVMDEENIGKDRTLGQFEIGTAEYVQQGDDGEYLIHDSKERIISAQLRVGNSAPKGTLNFTVAFYPTISVVDPEDEDEEESAVTDAPNGAQHSRSASALTAASTKTELDAAKVLDKNEKDQTEADELKTPEVPKIKIGVEDLSKYESGLVVFKLIDGQFAHTNSYLEILMDDMLYPAYTSGKIKSSTNTFNETGDAMVRELDLSKITLRVVTASDRKGDNEEEIVKAKITGATLETLKRSLYTTTTISLKDGQGREDKVSVSMRYIPVKMELDQSERFDNAGNLRVEVLDAADLPAADRNGYSDPYCIFRYGDKEVYKTKTVKKSLHPAWNEFFETQIRSRTAGGLTVDVYDWDVGSKADHLGASVIDLKDLEPFQPKEVRLPLDGKSGVVRLKMLFKPDYVVRSRQGSSTFSGTFAAPGKIIGAPVKGATFVGGVVGGAAAGVGGAAVGGISKGGNFLTKGFKRASSSHHAQSPSQDASAGGVAEMRDTSMETSAQNGHFAQDSVASTSTTALAPGAVGQSSEGATESGMATISVLSATGFPHDSKLQVRVLQNTSKGLREIIKTDTVKAKTGEATYDQETKRVPASTDEDFRVMVRDSHTFGSDELGEGSFSLATSNASASGTQEVKVGDGTVMIRCSLAASDAASLRPSTAQAPESPASKNKSLGRFKSRKERSVTPSG